MIDLERKKRLLRSAFSNGLEFLDGMYAINNNKIGRDEVEELASDVDAMIEWYFKYLNQEDAEHKAYQQGREDQKEEDSHGFTEEEATQYLYDLGCKDTVKLYHKYVEANLEANNFDVLINDEIRDTLLSKKVEEVLKMIGADKGADRMKNVNKPCIEMLKENCNGCDNAIEIDGDYCHTLRAYQQGKADAIKPIPIDKYDWSATTHEGKQLIAFDEFGQAFIPLGMIRITTEDNAKIVYDAKGYKFNNIKEFLKGEDAGNGIRIPPRKIEWYVEFPSTEQIEEQKNG